MSENGAILTAIQTALAAAAPARTVTRSLKDFGDRAAAELQAGVLTLLSRGARNEETLDLLLVGQIELAESATGEEIEEAELSLLDDVRRFAARVEGVIVTIRSYQLSQQLERPYGWIALQVEAGSFDFSPGANLAAAADFIAYHAEHAVADGTAPVPVATDNVTLPI